MTMLLEPSNADVVDAAATAPARSWRRVRLPDLRGDRAYAQLFRFALVGGLSNVSYVLLFMALHGVGMQVANIAGGLVSTVLANELHRRLTFHASDRVGWFTAQWEGGGLAVIALIASSAALAALGVAFPAASDVVQAAFVVGVSGVVGSLRFVALRGWVF